MCLKYFKIAKSSDVLGLKRTYVPCGMCPECREAQRNEWSKRLMLELAPLKEMGWSVGFLTLTYKPECLPFLHPSVFERPFDFKYVPCFSRNDVAKYIKAIRHDLDRYYGVQGLRYIVSSEYGESTARPHYHALFCWKNANGLTDEKVFELVSRKWKFGHTFPRCFNGGKDRHDYEHKPFILSGALKNACRYACKYVCKDLNFINALDGLELKRKSKLFKYSQPFHVQSKSLGACFLENRSDAFLKRAYEKGFEMVGLDKKLSLPVYLKRKILFKPKYVKNSVGKRLVRKEASDFMNRNLDFVFGLKTKAINRLFDQICNINFWRERVANPEQICKAVGESVAKAKSLFPDSPIGAVYLAYYGVPKTFPVSESLAKTWANRYELDSSGKIVKKMFTYSFIDDKQLYLKKLEFENAVSLALGYLDSAFILESFRDSENEHYKALSNELFKEL